MRTSKAIVDYLAEQGVSWIFGNPGTMELAIYDELIERQSPKLALGLQEISAVSMAMGYSVGSHGPAVVVMHTAAGLGNGMGALYDASRMGLPLVALVGQVDDRQYLDDPILFGDIVTMARPVTKWSYEARGPRDAVQAVGHGFIEAMRPPRGPVCISLPMNHLIGETSDPSPIKEPTVHRGVPDGLEDVCAALLNSENPLLVCGADLVWYEAVESVVRLAEMCGASVVSEPLNWLADFPSNHALYEGTLPISPSSIAKKLKRHDLCFVLGAPVFRSLFYEDVASIPVDTLFFQFSACAEQITDCHPGTRGFVGDLAAMLEKIVALVAKSSDSGALPHGASENTVEVRDKKSRKGSGADPRSPMEEGLRHLGQKIGERFAIVDECATNSWNVRQYFQRGLNNQYFANVAGGLGIGTGAAIGMSLANRDKEVLCLIGDGSIMYSCQGLWSAAHLEASVTYVVLQNNGYESLRQGYKMFDSMAAHSEDFVGTTLYPPEIDYQHLAAANGVPACRATTSEDLAEAVLAGTPSGPRLIVFDPTETKSYSSAGGPEA